VGGQVLLAGEYLAAIKAVELWMFQVAARGGISFLL